MKRWWLLELTIGGEVFRRTNAPDALEVEAAGGDTLVFSPGLGDLATARPDTWDVSIGLTIEDETAWHRYGAGMEDAPCTLLRWREGDVREEALVFAAGRARDVEWGEPGEGLSLSLTVEAIDSDLLLSPQARIDGATWPSGEVLTAPYVPEESAGTPYPIVIGFPGHAPSLGGPFCVVPVVFCDCTNDTPVGDVDNRLLLCEGEVDADVVAIADAERGAYTVSQLDVSTTYDLLGVEVSYTDFDADGSLKPLSPVGEQRYRFFAGYQDDTTFGGGLIDPYGDGLTVLRGVGDVIRWVLRRTCSRLRIDWEDVERSAPFFNAYQLDTWVNDPKFRGLEWLQNVVLPLVPHRWVTTGQGMSIRPWRWTATRDDAVAHLVAGENVERVSSCRVWAQPHARGGAEASPRANEVTVRYRQMRTHSAWRSSRVFTAQAEHLTVGPAPSSDDRILAHRLAAVSQRRYDEAFPLVVELAHVWDTATAEQHGVDLLRERALPHVTVSYAALDGELERLQVGDVVLLTDEDLEKHERVALVLPPIVGDEAGPTLELLLVHPLVRGGAV